MLEESNRREEPRLNSFLVHVGYEAISYDNVMSRENLLTKVSTKVLF